MSGYFEDVSQQVEDANEAARGEAWAAAELERDDFDDWSWWRR